MPKKTKRKKLIKYLPVVAAILIALLVILEITNVTSFIGRKSKENQEPISSVPTNTIDYGPAKPEDNVPVPDKTTKPSNTTPGSTSTTEKISVLVTRSYKSGDYYFIKAVISGSSNATCTAKMTKGGLSTSTSSSAEMIEGQYSCSNLKIPLSQFLENGSWKLEVTARDANGSTAIDSIQVNI